MNEQQALEELKALCDEHKGDIEYMHIDADKLLCKLLEAEYPNLVAQYKALPKWYA
jgi:hypothetical protein